MYERKGGLMGLKLMNRGHKYPSELFSSSSYVGGANGTQGCYCSGNVSIEIVTERGDLICAQLRGFACFMAE